MAAPRKKEHREGGSTGFIMQCEDRLAAAYLDVLAQQEPEAAKLLARKQDITALPRKKSRMKAYIDFWESLPPAQQYSLAERDAQLNHLRRLARIMGTTALVQAHNNLEPNTAGSIDFVIGRARAEGVAPAQLQKFLDENALAWFSLTGHPTNPASHAYTEAQIALAKILADPQAGPQELDSALEALCAAPVAGPHKTPLEEAQETLATLDVIFDAALAHRDLFTQALTKHGYAQQGVSVRGPLVRPCAWTLGDGDGNDALSAAVLEEGIALHRRRIIARYRDFCAQDSALCEGFDALAQTLKSAPAEFLQQAQQLKAQIPAGSDPGYLLSCFGFGFGTIDLRHNALDIMRTVTRLSGRAGIMDEKRFAALDIAQQSTMIAAWLADKDALATMARMKPGDLGPDAETGDNEDEDGAVAARIFGRLQIIGRNPDMCEKLIIAETTHSAHALAALLLLAAAGNEISNDKAQIDLVTLSESVADLTGLGTLLEALLENETFRAHVAARGQLVAMIAKSDTTRQDGRGEAEYAQYEAAVDIYRTADKMQRRYPALENILVSVKNGGGHALQRGGGRVTEIPAIHGRAAADARVTDCGPSTLTIQGQQQHILFCPGKTALGTLEALAAQNLYTKAGIQGEMPVPVFSRRMNKQYARADARLFAKSAGQAFDDLTKDNPALDELLVAAPWLAMKAGNVSSRPAARGERQAGPGITPRQAKQGAGGENPRALAGRAISGERLTAHACLPVFSVLGLREAMEAVRGGGMARLNPDKYGDPLHHLYRANKLFRDSARATLSAAAMADFDIAWLLLIGRARPPAAKVADLAQNFKNPAGPGENPPDVTLAFWEQYFLDTEKCAYEMVCGREAPASFKQGDGLRRLWPALAAQVEHRNRHAEFARVIECHRTRAFDENPDEPLDEIAYRTTQALYTAANVVGAPVGILATRTRLEPVYETGKGGRTRFMRPKSFQEDKVLHLLHLPAALIKNSG